MKQEQIKELEQTIGKDYSNIAGIVVRKNGETLYEKYFNGYTADAAFHVFSVTKSITSALIGMAIGQGYIGDIGQKVLEYFPDYTPKRGEKMAQNVTIKDMLTMTAPFKYKSAPYTKYFSSESWVKSALDLLGGKGKIGEFRYTPLIGPDILTGILMNATEEPVLDFANTHLFSPMGIEAAQSVVFHSKEEQLNLMKDYHRCGWVNDPQGVATAAWGLFMKPTDMAKIGQLYLNGGEWEGRQLVSAEWIKESTTVHSRWEEMNLSYGYLWWIIDADSYAAIGDGGNVIYVNTKKKLVVAIASLLARKVKDRVEFIKKVIEPIV
ncbi:MAG: serine hydrolase [Eubacteriales bacterium]